MLRLLTLVLALALAAPAAASPNPERLRLARSSPEEMTRFAVARVCLSVLVEGTTLETAVAGSGFPWKAPPGSFALNGTAVNHVKLDGRGGCYFRIDRGDHARLRMSVLDALTEAGAPPSTANAFDSGPDGSDGAGKFRQERYCLVGPATAGKTLGVVISSGTGRRPPLQVTLLAPASGPCS
jgi:hypothetical protein